MRFAQAVAEIPTAYSFAFTPDGSHVARIANRGGDPVVEVRAFGASDPSRVYGHDPLLSTETQLYFPSAHRIWIRAGRPGCFRLVQARRTARSAWTSAALEGGEAVSLWLLPWHRGGSSRAAGDLAIASTEDGDSTISRIDEDPLRLHPLATLPGFVTGGVWLEPPRLLALTINQPGRPSSGYLVDLTSKKYRRVFHVSDESNDAIAWCDPEPGRLWVTSDCPGYRRAGIADLGAGTIRFFREPPGEERSVEPFGRFGRRLVLRRQAGVTSQLWLADPMDLTLSGPLGLPSGAVISPVADAGDRLRFAFSGPTIPAACATYLPAGEDFALEEVPELGSVDADRLATPRVVAIPGPHGSVETLVYEPRCDRRNLIVVALHGGPAAQWSSAFSPELQLLQGLGAVVAAPNYHGSTGYGDGFVRALEHAGGSVDVDDVVSVIAAMRAEPGLSRAPVVLFGHSYGAFLGLLVAAAYPQLCEGVIAVAPFTSLASLGAGAKPPVRRMADLLGDPRSVDRQADLLRRCSDLRAKLLIAHGSEDTIIPVQQSHLLCRAARACGYRDGHDLWFLPLPGEGHSITGQAAVVRLYDQIGAFLGQAAMDRQSHPISDTHPSEGLDVAGRRPHRCAQRTRLLCDAIDEGR